MSLVKKRNPSSSNLSHREGIVSVTVKNEDVVRPTPFDPFAPTRLKTTFNESGNDIKILNFKENLILKTQSFNQSFFLLCISSI